MTRTTSAGVQPTARLTKPAARTFTTVLIELALKYGDPRGIRGDHLHAWFLTQLKGRSPALADRLHADTRHKPLALWVGPRFGLGPHGVTRDTGDDRYWLRIASLDSELNRLLPAIAASRTIVVGRAELTPVYVMADADTHQWAGSVTASHLWNYWRDADSHGHVRLRFISPTAFGRDRNAVHLLPTGALVFRSLIEIWNDHGHPPIDDDLANALLDSVREERHEIWTVPPVPFGNYRVKGFMGTCGYSSQSDDPRARRLLHLLADFAFYSGVGLKRGMGMGQVLGEEVSHP